MNPFAIMNHWFEPHDMNLWFGPLTWTIAMIPLYYPYLIDLFLLWFALIFVVCYIPFLIAFLCPYMMPIIWLNCSQSWGVHGLATEAPVVLTLSVEVGFCPQRSLLCYSTMAIIIIICMLSLELGICIFVFAGSVWMHPRYFVSFWIWWMVCVCNTLHFTFGTSS